MSNKLMKQTMVNWMNDLLCLQLHVTLCDFCTASRPLKNDSILIFDVARTSQTLRGMNSQVCLVCGFIID